MSLSEIVDAIKTVEGVIGIILFGSVARGDYDEGSDIDLLVIFRDEDLMRRNEWEVTRRIPSDVFAQSICVCPSMLKSANPVFLRSVLDDGVILYMRHPFVSRFQLACGVPYFIVSYSLEGLSQREKQKVDYKLFGRVVGERSYEGAVEKCGGKRLGRGCFLVPKESSESVLNLLKKYSLRYDLMEAYLPKVEKFPFEISL
ncbi:MAG: nucleotidyltransferase domain-containing protein [Candidatus Bathyarchaeia archaeon]|nr:nucleotidyltransferase domain-containing protein [Candidatus Bathyarchaeia archaeon]